MSPKAVLPEEQKVSEVSLTDLETAVDPRQEDPEEDEANETQWAVGERALVIPTAQCDPCDPKFGKRILLGLGVPKTRFIGNMVILRRHPLIVLGPYWLMLVFVTFPLVVLGPAVVAVIWCSRFHFAVQLAYAANVAIVFGALLSTALRDPGLLQRRPTAPAPDWNWNDQAQTFKPPGARYCPWCDVVITHFDHTCPWTGTGIVSSLVMA